jgi:DNA-binding response OmpR family regulator
MKILLVEDSERLCRAVGTGLRKAGFAVDIASDGQEGLHLAQCGDYDVIVLDLMLPKLDGLSLLRSLRGGGKDTHVLILTARDAVEDRVKGLRAGADDYLTKPFDFDELLARIEALVRRRYGRKDPTIRIGDIELNTATRTVGRNGRTVDLAPREYALLEYLAVRAGELVTRTEIEEHIYDDIVSPMSNVVDSAICNLRKKLTTSISGDPIRTRRGMGYVLEAPE